MLTGTMSAGGQGTPPAPLGELHTLCRPRANARQVGRSHSKGLTGDVGRPDFASARSAAMDERDGPRPRAEVDDQRGSGPQAG